MVSISDTVRFVETDMMGVVHHSNYFRWFEMGRVAYLRQAGISLHELMAEDIVFPIRHVECRYLAPARFDDVIRIETTLAQLTRAQFKFTYRVVRESDAALLATGATQSVFTDPAGKVIRLPEVYYNKMRAVADQA